MAQDAFDGAANTELSTHDSNWANEAGTTTNTTDAELDGSG